MHEKKSNQVDSPKQPVFRLLAVIIIVVVAICIYMTRPAANSPQSRLDDQVSTMKNLPALKDFGSDKCVPCKMMAPILEELKTEYAEVFTVEFFDIWKNTEAGTKYEIKVIPTQIFFAPDGTELFRHEGFFSREDILNKWQELQVKI